MDYIDYIESNESNKVKQNTNVHLTTSYIRAC